MSCAHLNEKQIVEEGKYNASSGELNYLNSLLCYVFLAYWMVLSVVNGGIVVHSTVECMWKEGVRA